MYLFNYLHVNAFSFRNLVASLDYKLKVLKKDLLLLICSFSNFILFLSSEPYLRIRKEFWNDETLGRSVEM